MRIFTSNLLRTLYSHLSVYFISYFPKMSITRYLNKTLGRFVVPYISLP